MASEFDLIAAIGERLPSAGERVRVPSGDDAAVIEPSGPAAVSVDAIVEGVHFRRPAFGMEAVGRKALAAALSDLAAMGAEPGEAYIAVGGELDRDELLELAAGLADVASRHEVTVAGGDLVRSPVLFCSVTVVGYETEGVPLVTRDGAQPGDVVVVTGELGGGAAALAVLLDEMKAPAGEPSALLDRQLDPSPRLAEGHVLASAGATAMIDLSDGLGADAGHVADASGCGLEIDLAKIPVAGGVETVAGGERQAIELAASGGEDFELLAAIPPDRIKQAAGAVEHAGGRLTEIGYATDGRGVILRLPDGERLEPSGFDHSRGSLSGSG